MTKELFFAYEIEKSDLGKSVHSLTKDIPGLRVQSWASNQAERGPTAGKAIPDIIMIDDNLESGDLFTRTRTIKKHFPLIALFVVSSNTNPQNIIDVMKAGAAEYLVEPIDRQLLQNAIEEVRAKLSNAGQLAQGSVYSFVSAKGGVGATVVAVNTATAMAQNKKASTALIDMSFQSGDASVLLDIVPQNTITDICSNIHRLDVSFIRGVMSSDPSGLSFLAAPFNPEDSEDIKGEHIAKVLSLSRKLFDHVVLDCASMHVNDCSVEAFRQSDKVFVVTDMSVPSIRNTVRLCKLIRKFDIPLEKIEIIVNRFIKGGALSLGEIEKSFDKPVYWLIPNDFSDIVSSINRGTPLVKMSPGAPFSKNILQFVKKIQNSHDEPDFRGIRGTFGKIL